ncbi:MAG: pentapeptide repeat-containing protein, partial [Solimonas sp.]
MTRIDLDALVEERELEGGVLASVSLDGANLRGLRLIDVRGEHLSAVNGDWRGAGLLRVELREARLTGLDLG